MVALKVGSHGRNRFIREKNIDKYEQYWLIHTSAAGSVRSSFFLCMAVQDVYHVNVFTSKFK